MMAYLYNFMRDDVSFTRLMSCIFPPMFPSLSCFTHVLEYHAKRLLLASFRADSVLSSSDFSSDCPVVQPTA